MDILELLKTLACITIIIIWSLIIVRLISTWARLILEDWKKDKTK